MGDFLDLFNQLDADPRVRGRQFERICQWFLRNDPVYSGELRPDRVWLWNEWPGRWGADAGVDLVAEDRQGHLWAIQAKAYAEDTWITKRDVDTFLAEAGRPEFSFRLLIATTNRIGPTAKRTIESQEKQTSVVLLGDLEAAEVNWPDSPSALRARALPRKRPRPHQRKAMNAVVKGFEGADRGQMIMACGTGKTLAALFIQEKLAATRTLVLVPSLSLLAQTLREWTANTSVGFEFLPVCSDRTVAEPDAVVSNTSDLGFPVTTAPERIAAFLRKRSGPRVVFGTYQSSPEIAAAFRLGRVPGFDLVIADEAHRCAGRVSSDFATILYDGAIKARRRLFMTATPRYFTGRVEREAEEAEFEVASMDDKEAFGQVFHRLGFAEAIERELLTDYQVVVVGVDDATYLDWAKRGRFVTLDGTEVTDARTLAGQIGLAKAMRRYDLNRTITFHSRVKRAREFARELPEVIAWMPARQRPKGRLWTDYASGEMPAGQRHVLLQHLSRLDQGERGLLANARCLSEGVDVPTLDGVAFIDPRRSEVDIVQAVGRAIRKSGSKAVGTVVIPVFIDTDSHPEIVLNSSVFKPVWDVIQALRAHDTELGEQLDALRREMGRQGGHPRLPDKIHIDIPARVGVGFANAFDVRLIRSVTVSWMESMGWLQAYFDEHGTSLVPDDYVTADGFRLGQWVGVQRGRYGKGKLAPERIAALERFADWSWNPRADRWQRGFEELQRYYGEHGTVLVSDGYVTPEGYRLGQWVMVQRGDHRKGRLAAERSAALEAFADWSWSALDSLWQRGLEELEKYLDEHGTTNVPQHYATPEGFKLGTWVSTQRGRYRRGTLRGEQIANLERFSDWSWRLVTAKWEHGFKELQEYYEECGTTYVPQGYKTPKGFRLGVWVNSQRANYRKGKLSGERAAALEGLGDWTWDPYETAWQQGFSALQTYHDTLGTTLVPRSYKAADGFKLGQWVKLQRLNYSTGKLSDERIAALEHLDDWAWNQEDRWQNLFDELHRYYDEHGTTLVPRDYQDGALAYWVQNQRTFYRDRKLSDERIRALEGFADWSWRLLDDKWQNGFDQLQKYYEEYGTTNVPQGYETSEGFKLGVWVSTQRTTYRKGKLYAERAAALEGLGNWTWGPHETAWQNGFNELQRHYEEHGTARIPIAYVTPDGYRLGTWVNSQRTNYGQGTLSVERIKQLESLGDWVWRIR